MGLSKICAVLLSLPAVFGAAALPSGDQCGGASGVECPSHVDDGSSLLQTRVSVGDAEGESELERQLVSDEFQEAASSHQASGYCPGVTIKPLAPSQSAFIADKLGKTHLGWWNFPVQQDFSDLERLRAGLTRYRWGEELESVSDDDSWPDIRGSSPEEVIPLMNEATKLPGLFEKVPKKLQGVFWMKGNAIAEELTVMQAGLWFEEEKTYYTTMQPYMWAWAQGVPRNAPQHGTLYRGKKALKNGGNILRKAVGFSYAFGACDGHKYCKDQSDDMAYSYMDLAWYSNLVNSTNIGSLVTHSQSKAVSGAFTLQAMSDDGTRWERTCNWGSGSCAFMEFGSYELLKVMDGDGERVQPYYDEFIEYMGDVPLVTWTGWESEAARKSVEDRFKRDFQ